MFENCFRPPTGDSLMHPIGDRPPDLPRLQPSSQMKIPGPATAVYDMFCWFYYRPAFWCNLAIKSWRTRSSVLTDTVSTLRAWRYGIGQSMRPASGAPCPKTSRDSPARARCAETRRNLSYRCLTSINSWIISGLNVARSDRRWVQVGRTLLRVASSCPPLSCTQAMRTSSRRPVMTAQHAIQRSDIWDTVLAIIRLNCNT